MWNSSRIRRAVIATTAVVSLLLIGRATFDRPRYRSHSTLPHGQCTWYALERAYDDGWLIRFDTGWGRHARNWWEKVVNADRGAKPRPGAIMVLDAWPGNRYGHVAFVESVESDGRWTISHANLPATERWQERDGVSVYRASFEPVPNGVRLAGTRHTFPLRGFLYPRPRLEAATGISRLRAERAPASPSFLAPET
jgi:surface antigen